MLELVVDVHTVASDMDIRFVTVQESQMCQIGSFPIEKSIELLLMMDSFLLYICT